MFIKSYGKRFPKSQFLKKVHPTVTFNLRIIKSAEIGVVGWRRHGCPMHGAATARDGGEQPLTATTR